MTSALQSPALRRSPRLHPNVNSSGMSDSTNNQSRRSVDNRVQQDSAPNAAVVGVDPPDLSNSPHRHTRRVLFHPSLEPVSVPVSVDVSDPIGLLTNNSSANTIAPGSVAERFSDLDTVAPNSQARRNSDLDTVAPNSQARRYSDLDTVAPNSQARRYSDMDTVAPNSQARRYSDLETAAPDSQARRYSDLETVAPHSQARELHDVVTMSPAPEREERQALPVTHSNQPQPLPSRPPMQNMSPEDGAFVIDGEGINGAEQTRISEADEITRVFGFLSQLPVKRLRVILRRWEWRQSGKKEALVAKAMLQVKLSIASGKSLSELLSKHDETRRYYSWLRMRLSRDENYPVSITKVPSEAALVSLLSASEASEYRLNKLTTERVRSGLPPEPGQPDVDMPHNSALTTEEEHIQNNRGQAEITDSSTQFNISEFARLLIIMRDDEDARAAAIAMGQELTRAQLDSGVTRGDFWAIVATRYNDPTQDRFLNMTGAVDGVDSRLPPSAHRSATFLKEKFNDAKADFTQYVTRWSASGQNDPDRFRNFLPKVANGELSALGKRMMAMFVCSRKGTPFEEEQFTNLCCKLIPGGRGRDEGSRRGSNGANGGSDNSSRRKRGSPESGGLNDVASTLSRIASVCEARNAEKEGNQPDKDFKSFSYRLKKIKLFKDVTKEISGLPSVDAELDGDGQNDFMREQLKKLQADVRNNLCSL